MSLTWFDPKQERGRVLVVDDQAINVRLLHELFHHDFDMFMATTGQQALETCRKLLPDVILLDIEMPDLSGFEVCLRLKADSATAHIPVIFITSHFDEAQEVQGFQVGGADFIRKPINPVVTKVRVQNQFALKRQADILRSIALLDGLTGVANRRKFEMTMTTTWLQCARDKTPLSLVVLDVDYFKKYNDHYGHAEGDLCLRNVAQTIKSCLKRPMDLLARYGGEEFVCVLPQSDLAGASHVAKLIVNTIAELAMPHQLGINGVVTVSAGVAAINPVAGEAWQPLFEAADKQLYQAKQKGRNQVAA